MREIIALSVGFLIARQIYVNLDKRQAKKKEQHLKKRLSQFLKKEGIDSANVKRELNEIMD